MNMTSHADQRAKQRGVPQLIIDLLLEFGRREPAGNGAEKVFFDRRAKKKLSNYSGGLIRKFSEELDVYAVISGNHVVTVGTRTKRINRI